jgi:hypothetical protein
MSSTALIPKFKRCRSRGVPLLAIASADPGATIERLSNGGAAAAPSIMWDLCRGWRPINKPGELAILEVMDAAGGADPSAATSDPVEMLQIHAPRLPADAILFMANAHRFLGERGPAGASFTQAIWNLRDLFKVDGRTLVLLGPSFTLPPEIANDVLILDEPLPDDAELGGILDAIVQQTEGAPKLAAKDRSAAITALRGLAAFPSEQAAALAVGKAGMDVEELWRRKIQMVEATPGCSVWRGGERFADVGGNRQVKRYLSLEIAAGINVVVFFDEIEKQLAGAQGDNTGVTQAQHGKLLSYMQDKNVEGLRFIGPPGAGKSAVAKAIGSEAGVLTIAVDLGSAKGGIVGQSEEQLDAILKVIDAVGGGRALFVATCNRDAVLSPELRRRFATTFYFDLPDAEERAAIWAIYRQRYELGDAKANPAPEDRDWTGAEIRQAARLASRLKIPLAETAQYIVPVAKAAAEEIAALRRQADRKFLSASKPGVYELRAAPAESTPKGRRIGAEV